MHNTERLLYVVLYKDSQKLERLAPCPKLPASCKLQVPFGCRRITPPISPGTEPTTNGRLVVAMEARLGRDPLSLTATLS
ncbi:hypothetical protein GOODEAATRI_012993 [Goodea atripinnis]|uniref:Uncharacterized protein n=1 Tax=Goodea atripinnis TaxID=208336 RepID=A0ABV0PXM4_9TELE